jgi:hypothetical protein
MLDISNLLSQLTNALTGHLFTVAPIPQRDGIYLGIDTLNHPCLFVEAKEKLAEPVLRTACVSLRPNQTYQLTLTDSSQKKGVFHALICETTNHSDKITFMVLVEAFLAQNSDLPSASQNIAPFFRSLTRLFAIDTARDLKTERQGLWGELFIMKEIRGYRFWAPFWHSEVTRLFDFSGSDKRLEVKTTTSGQRFHHFSHRQVYAFEGEEINIASLLIHEDDAGLSLRSLIDECRAELLHTPYFLKLEKAVRHAGMEDPSEASPKFNPTEAKLRLGWFHSIDIPHFCVPEPPGVSQTSYRVDLSEAPQLNIDGLNIWLDSWSKISIE